jgi:hypothetical protein
MLHVIDEFGSRLPRTDNSRCGKVQSQFLRMTSGEQQRLLAILRQARGLDRRLGELHLVLPMLEIRFYGLPPGETNCFTPDELLNAIASWRAQRE